MEFSPFEYMRWAKSFLNQGGYNLIPSGLSAPPAETFQADASCLSFRHLAGYLGEGELARRIARRYGAKPEEILVSLGASQTLYLLYAVLLGPGDRVLVETPCYETLRRGPALLGAKVQLLERRFEERYRLDLNRLRREAEAGVRLLMLTHLHNPSGAPLEMGTLRDAAEVLWRRGGTIVVNEVYREFLLGEPPCSSLASNVITVSSLTKAFGLGPLRIGWAIAPEEIVERAKAYSDYLNVLLPAPSVLAAVSFFDRIGPAEERIRSLEVVQRPILDAWLKRESRIECVLPGGGITCFPKIRGVRNTQGFAAWLLKEFGVAAVPGEFFGAPGHLRIGFGGPPEVLEEGLRRLSRALDLYGGS